MRKWWIAGIVGWITLGVVGLGLLAFMVLSGWRPPGGQSSGLITFARVPGYPDAIEYTPDGEGVVIATQGDGAYLTSALDGSIIRKFDKGFVRELALSPDGEVLVTRAADDKTVNVWRVADGTLLRSITEGTTWVSELDFSPDGEWLAIGSNGQVKLWRVSDWTEKWSSASQDFSLGFSPDGRTIAVGGMNIALLDAATGKTLHTLPGHGFDVAFTPDSRVLAVPASVNSGDVILYDVSSARELRRLEGTDTTYVQAQVLTFTPDGASLVVGYNNGTARIWRTSDGVLQQTLQLERNKSPSSLAFSTDGGTLLIGTYQAVLKWDTAKGE